MRKPKFCENCGNELIKELKHKGYNKYTGYKTYFHILKCKKASGYSIEKIGATYKIKKDICVTSITTPHDLIQHTLILLD